MHGHIASCIYCNYLARSKSFRVASRLVTRQTLEAHATGSELVIAKGVGRHEDALRRGFSLYDLLGLLMVIGVVAMIGMALVLQGTRCQPAERLCVSNLKQIAQAMHSYQATHGCYPLSVTASFIIHPAAAMSRGGQNARAGRADWSGWKPLRHSCFNISTRHHF